MTIVRIEDCRALKYCTAGVRRFFTKHGMDFASFVRDGLHEDGFPKDDILAANVIAQAKQREATARG